MQPEQPDSVRGTKLDTYLNHAVAYVRKKRSAENGIKHAVYLIAAWVVGNIPGSVVAVSLDNEDGQTQSTWHAQMPMKPWASQIAAMKFYAEVRGVHRACMGSGVGTGEAADVTPAWHRCDTGGTKSTAERTANAA